MPSLPSSPRSTILRGKNVAPFISWQLQSRKKKERNANAYSVQIFAIFSKNLCILNGKKVKDLYYQSIHMPYCKISVLQNANILENKKCHSSFPQKNYHVTKDLRVNKAGKTYPLKSAFLGSVQNRHPIWVRFQITFVPKQVSDLYINKLMIQ